MRSAADCLAAETRWPGAAIWLSEITLTKSAANRKGCHRRYHASIGPASLCCQPVTQHASSLPLMWVYAVSMFLLAAAQHCELLSVSGFGLDAPRCMCIRDAVSQRTMLPSISQVVCSSTTTSCRYARRSFRYAWSQVAGAPCRCTCATACSASGTQRHRLLYL
jgi:hypothetical protein